MAITTVSAREFARDLAHAKKAADHGPVIVTDRGRPRYALLKIADSSRLTAPEPRSLLTLMDALPSGNFDFEPATVDGALRQADL
jgi:PHD/YefM family antitoxin component YafN of YafNO toxin-antitoxin module